MWYCMVRTTNISNTNKYQIVYAREIRRLAKIEIKKNVCKGCGLCIPACPKGILYLSETEINQKGYSPVEIIDMRACIGCAACATVCPDAVFSVYK